eukprot:scaffold311_cov173-Amphora_coffeaeformis.AAC.3
MARVFLVLGNSPNVMTKTKPVGWISVVVPSCLCRLEQSVPWTTKLYERRPPFGILVVVVVVAAVVLEALQKVGTHHRCSISMTVPEVFSMHGCAVAIVVVVVANSTRQALVQCPESSGKSKPSSTYQYTNTQYDPRLVGPMPCRRGDSQRQRDVMMMQF